MSQDDVYGSLRHDEDVLKVPTCSTAFPFANCSFLDFFTVSSEPRFWLLKSWVHYHDIIRVFGREKRGGPGDAALSTRSGARTFSTWATLVMTGTIPQATH